MSSGQITRSGSYGYRATHTASPQWAAAGCATTAQRSHVHAAIVAICYHNRHHRARRVSCCRRTSRVCWLVIG
eukprot:COSAG03_NODE_264_length_9700_cov_10.107176_7_plen_73_part_00